AGRRPWVILTRTEAVEVLNQVLAAPATRTVRAIPTEVAVDEADGMPTSCVFALDNVAPIRTSLCTTWITTLAPPTMAAICTALGHATACS
ncbi:MAG: type II toxin-antitoxin system PemK/MazF family toxin, partial [Actinomycetota bacterium]|nr:type II toxin-antitoxin system PemK/MazF family toxin [Actinomycetota bacterium]